MPNDLQIPIVNGGASRSVASGYRPRRASEPGFRVMTIAAVAIGGVLAAGLGGWSLLARRPATVPLIEADSRPLRVKPENPGGLQVVGADEMGAGGVERLAPAPEAPAPQALRAQVQQAGPARLPAGAAPPAPVAPGAQVAASVAPAPGSSVSPLPDTPTREVPGGRAAADAAPRATLPGATLPSATTPTAAIPAAAPHNALPHSTTMVQLAAVASEAAAQAEWQRLSRRMPDLLGERRPVVQRAEAGGHAVYRIRTGGFADLAEATGFCMKVKAKGAACTLASF